MFLLALAFYFRLVSTTSIDSEVPEDGVIVLPAIDNQREVILVDPTLLYGTKEHNRNGSSSDNTGSSTEKVRQILSNETGSHLKNWVNHNPGSDLLNHLKKVRIQSENETILSTDPKSTKILWRILRKGLPEFDNKPSPSLLKFLRNLNDFGNDIPKLPHSNLHKTLSRQGVEKEISKPWSLSNFLDPFLFLKSFMKPVSENATKHLPSTGQTPRRVDRKKRALNPLRWLTNDSGSPNLLSSLKRSRRQANNETEGVVELPRWEGMPKGALRAPYMETDAVKRKLLGMMLQSLYSAQERLWPLAPIVRRYEALAPYRMAFIFLKLDQLVNEGHQILMYLKRQFVNEKMTITRRLQLYSQIMRRNIDVTYLVDYIMERVPQDQVVRIRQWVIRDEQENIMKRKEAWDKTRGTRIAGRPAS